MNSNPFTYPPAQLPQTEQILHRYSWESQSKISRRIRGLMPVSSIHSPVNSSPSNDTINLPVEDDFEIFAVENEEEEQDGGNQDGWESVSISSEGSHRNGYSTPSDSEASSECLEDEQVFNSNPEHSHENDVNNNLDEWSDFVEVGIGHRAPCNSLESSCSSSSLPNEHAIEAFSWDDFYEIVGLMSAKLSEFDVPLTLEHFVDVLPRIKKSKQEGY